MSRRRVFTSRSIFGGLSGGVEIDAVSLSAPSLAHQCHAAAKLDTSQASTRSTATIHPSEIDVVSPPSHLIAFIVESHRFATVLDTSSAGCGSTGRNTDNWRPGDDFLGYKRRHGSVTLLLLGGGGGHGVILLWILAGTPRPAFRRGRLCRRDGDTLSGGRCRPRAGADPLVWRRSPSVHCLLRTCLDGGNNRNFFAPFGCSGSVSVNSMLA